MSGITPLKKVLTELSRLPKVIGIFIISKEGFVIDSISSREAFDEEALAAMATAALGSIEALGKELDLGKPEIITLEYTGTIVLSYDLGENLVILVAEKGAVIGRLRYELKKNIPRISAAL